jgi:adenylate cyclase
MRPPSQGSGQGTWVDAALRAYEDRNLTRVTVARTAMFVTIWVYLLANYGRSVAVANLGILALFVAFGLVAYALMHGRSERLWPTYVFVVLDAVLLAYTLLALGRAYPEGWPWQTVLRQPSFRYFLTIPALAALSFRPFLVLWSGLVVACAWGSATWLIAREPGAIVGMADLGLGAPDSAYLARYFSPAYVHPDDAVVRVFLLLVVVAILAYGAASARRLVHEQVDAARERANLARYVAPNMVERLSHSDNPLAPVRSQAASVLFADIRGFTAAAERLGAVATCAPPRKPAPAPACCSSRISAVR